MRRKMKLNSLFLVIFLLVVIGIISLINCDLFSSGYEEYDFELMEFPFANPAEIRRMAAFGIPNWSGTEPHNGIDLIINESVYSARILSPTNGTIDSIEMSENPFSHPANQLILTITIYINSEWKVALVIEPGTTDEWVKTSQRNAVLVQEGDTVYKSQYITDLLVGEQGYPHLHYMILRDDVPVCAYLYSSTIARQMFENIRLTRSDNNLPDGNICYGGDY